MARAFSQDELDFAAAKEALALAAICGSKESLLVDLCALHLVRNALMEAAERENPRKAAKLLKQFDRWKETCDAKHEILLARMREDPN